MHFEIVHEFDIPLDALELAVISPNLQQNIAKRLASAESLLQKEHVLKDGKVDRVWVYRSSVKLPAITKPYITPEQMAWDQVSTYDIKRHAGEWTLTPPLKAAWRQYFSAAGTYELEQLETGRTRRKVSGTIELRVPVVRQVAEKLVAAEVKRTFEAEAETLRDMATLV